MMNAATATASESQPKRVRTKLPRVSPAELQEIMSDPERWVPVAARVSRRPEQPLFLFERVRRGETIKVSIGRSFSLLVVGTMLIVSRMFGGGANIEWLAAAWRVVKPIRW